uniref:F-box domain-containing protein n=1 Tax=Kalanchoe fedtschenkoi TaxID=63787 RepID=A0A7N0V261_KALFE
MAKKRKRIVTATTATTTTTIDDMPSDTLLLIIGQLGRSDLPSLSLVSKRFRSLADRFVRRLTFPKLPIRNSTLQKLFSRFSSVNHIVLRCVRIPRVLSAVLSSALDIEHLEIVGRPTGGYPSFYEQRRMFSLCGRFQKIKALGLGFCLDKVEDDDLAQFVQNFPSLQELDLSVPGWTDVRINKLTSKVPNLRKISLCWCDTMTDTALDSLSANCVNLEEICFQGWTEFSPEVFCRFLRKARNLRSVKLPDFYQSIMQPELLLLGEAISACENLVHLSIQNRLVNDEILGAISKSRAPLTSLHMELKKNNEAYSMKGVSAMLCAFPELTQLWIELPYADFYLQDERMSHLVKSLPRLKDITVTTHCPMFATLFSLIGNCHLLECIRLYVWMKHYRESHHEQMRRNYSIKRIEIHPDPDKLLKKHLKSICASVTEWNFK